MSLFFAFLVALLVTMVLVPPLIRVAPRVQLVDIPDVRKVHAGRIPRIGGIAIVAGAVLSILVLAPMDQELLALLAGVGVLLCFGVLDDRGGLDYRWKFFGQFLAVMIVVVGGGVVLTRVP